MSIYKELNPMVEHRIPEVFNGTREHMAKSNTPNMTYPSQHIDIKITKRSRDHVVIPNTLKITLNIEIESTDKTRSVVNNGGRALVKKRSSYLVQQRLTRLTTLIFMTHTRTFT